MVSSSRAKQKNKARVQAARKRAAKASKQQRANTSTVTTYGDLPDVIWLDTVAAALSTPSGVPIKSSDYKDSVNENTHDRDLGYDVPPLPMPLVMRPSRRQTAPAEGGCRLEYATDTCALSESVIEEGDNRQNATDICTPSDGVGEGTSKIRSVPPDGEQGRVTDQSRKDMPSENSATYVTTCDVRHGGDLNCEPLQPANYRVTESATTVATCSEMIPGGTLESTLVDAFEAMGTHAIEDAQQTIAVDEEILLTTTQPQKKRKKKKKKRKLKTAAARDGTSAPCESTEGLSIDNIKCDRPEEIPTVKEVHRGQSMVHSSASGTLVEIPTLPQRPRPYSKPVAQHHQTSHKLRRDSLESAVRHDLESVTGDDAPAFTGADTIPSDKQKEHSLQSTTVCNETDSDTSALNIFRPNEGVADEAGVMSEQGECITQAKGEVEQLSHDLRTLTGSAHTSCDSDGLDVTESNRASDEDSVCQDEEMMNAYMLDEGDGSPILPVHEIESRTSGADRQQPSVDIVHDDESASSAEENELQDELVKCGDGVGKDGRQLSNPATTLATPELYKEESSAHTVVACDVVNEVASIGRLEASVSQQCNMECDETNPGHVEQYDTARSYVPQIQHAASEKYCAAKEHSPSVQVIVSDRYNAVSEGNTPVRGLAAEQYITDQNLNLLGGCKAPEIYIRTDAYDVSEHHNPAPMRLNQGYGVAPSVGLISDGMLPEDYCRGTHTGASGSQYDQNAPSQLASLEDAVHTYHHEHVLATSSQYIPPPEIQSSQPLRMVPQCQVDSNGPDVDLMNVYVGNIPYMVPEDVIVGLLQNLNGFMGFRLCRTDLGDSKGYGFCTVAGEFNARTLISQVEFARVQRVADYISRTALNSQSSASRDQHSTEYDSANTYPPEPTRSYQTETLHTYQPETMTTAELQQLSYLWLKYSRCLENGTLGNNLGDPQLVEPIDNRPPITHPAQAYNFTSTGYDNQFAMASERQHLGSQWTPSTYSQPTGRRGRNQRKRRGTRGEDS